ncbi:MAG: glycine zipper 2TM domain-containing protein [Alphaproteobacteria bacterium]|nr:glycine zipper 2TM domain-containing protein [Alphaproteobacteria bacterium]
MNVNKIVGGTFLMCSVVLFSGCSTNPFSGNTYDSASMGEVSRTDTGTIVSLRKIEIKSEGTGAGTALGAVGGALAGSLFGGGDGKYLTTAAGAVIGGVAGNAIENRSQDGIEYTIQLDNGSTVTIAQGLTPALSVGQKVRVIYSNRGQSRVVAA